MFKLSRRTRNVTRIQRHTQMRGRLGGVERETTTTNDFQNLPEGASTTQDSFVSQDLDVVLSSSRNQNAKKELLLW